MAAGTMGVFLEGETRGRDAVGTVQVIKAPDKAAPKP